MNAVEDNKKMTDGRQKKRPGVDEQKRIIMDAAVELFIQKGVGAVSISQICEFADVSRPTFYRCFTDKDALVVEVYSASVKNHVHGLMNKLNPMAFLELGDLKNALDEMLDAIFENSKYAQFIFSELGTSESPASKSVQALFDASADFMLQQFIKRSGEAPSRLYLKSVMASFQWVVYETISKGCTPEAIYEAKIAAYELADQIFLVMEGIKH